MAGKKGKCPGCGALFTIPAPAKPASPGGPDPFDIPFVSASTNQANGAFWQELQRSAATPISNSPSEERSIQVSSGHSSSSYMQNAMQEARERESRARQKGTRTKSPELSVIAVLVLVLCVLILPIALFKLYDTVTFMQSKDYVKYVEWKKEYNPNIHKTEGMSDSEIESLKATNRKLQQATEKMFAQGLVTKEELWEVTGRNGKLAAEQMQIASNKIIKMGADFYDEMQRYLIASPIVSVLAVLISGVCFRYLLRPSE
jgi:Flp pilus assembly protein TadB